MPFLVDWQQERLSVSAHGAPLARVLLEVARRTGLELRGASVLKRNTDVHFSGLLLRDGLKQLLASVNSAIVETPSGFQTKRHLIVVVLAGPSDQRTVQSNPGPDAHQGLSVAETGPQLLARLHRAADARDLDALRKAAANGDRVAQAVALQLLSRLDPDQAGSLAAAASRSPDLNRRLTSLQVLGNIDSAAAVQALGAALSDSNTAARQAAVMGLIGQSSPEAVTFLTQALQDRDASVRMLALDFLAQRSPDALASAAGSGDLAISARARQLLRDTAAQQ
ncbi:MAG TPA: HEAT repeat domain-containing protein [Candidatus Binataceae bacterium]|nr:HEAT repeat domain-containing protein [Candidatus Binataceae bacterium]